jgi:hypothetical protein
MPSIGSLLGFFSSYARGVVQHTEDAHPKRWEAYFDIIPLEKILEKKISRLL